MTRLLFWRVFGWASIVLFVALQATFWIAQSRGDDRVAVPALRLSEAVVAVWLVIVIVKDRERIARFFQRLRRD